MSTLTVSQAQPVAVSRGPRSQLAAKNTLATLRQVFGNGVFTSRDAAPRLGLNFRYVSKELSRMAARPYNYLSIVRTNPRRRGGFENVYTISPRGWSKIDYYRAHTPVPAKQTEVTYWDSMSNAVLLLYGTGHVFEVMTSYLSKKLGQGWKMPALFDDLGQMLVLIDPDRGPDEAVLAAIGRSSPMLETIGTVDRALYLQKIGLIPESVEIPAYVAYNKAKGIPESTIMNALLIRGGIELRAKLAEQKTKSESLETNQKIIMEKVEPLLTEKRKEQLEKNASLKEEVSDGRLERSRLRLRNENLRQYLVTVSRQLSALSEEMKTIENPSLDAKALKTIVYNNILPIAAMNYVTWNTNKP